MLDLGCGTGRDTRALIDAGMTVTATDGSPEMAREAEKRLAVPVRVQLFEDLDDVVAFDGIWANASPSTCRAPACPTCSAGRIAR